MLGARQGGDGKKFSASDLLINVIILDVYNIFQRDSAILPRSGKDDLGSQKNPPIFPQVGHETVPWESGNSGEIIPRLACSAGI